MDTSITHQIGEREELTIAHRGKEFTLVPTAYGFELLTIHRLPVNTVYPPSPKTGRLFNVGNIEYLRPKHHRAGGRNSEGWGSPQIRRSACTTPQGAALQLLAWLDRRPS